MVGIVALWLPIVVAAVAVFVVSSVLHMALTYHRSDYRQLPSEPDVLDTLRRVGVARGTYMFPFCSHKEMGSAESIEKFKKGPVGILTILPSGPPAMPKYLAQWFVYTLVVSFFVAYITGRTVVAGAEYLAVFRVAGATAFMAYGVSQLADSIWTGQLWGVTFKHVFDGLLYALVTAGVFGWLWP